MAANEFQPDIGNMLKHVGIDEAGIGGTVAKESQPGIGNMLRACFLYQTSDSSEGV